MSDRSAPSVRDVLSQKGQETEDRGQEASDQTLTPALSQGEREEVEQETAEVAEVNAETTEELQSDAIGRLTPPARQDTLTPALSQGERETQQRGQLAERIRQSEALPAGLRARLAELVLAEDGAAGEQAIRAVEAALPLALRMSLGEVVRPAHPGGETFFRGDASGVSEEAAEALARGQLARSGMLRGQRARAE